MANLNYIHSAKILKAALPYFDYKTKPTMDLLAKLLDFMGSFHAISKAKDLAACDYEQSEIDAEGMLNAIRPLCYDHEKAIVDQILGFFNARRMFENYKKYMDLMKTMEEMGGFSFDGFNNDDYEADDSEPPYQKQTEDYSSETEDRDSDEAENSRFDFDAFLKEIAGDEYETLIKDPQISKFLNKDQEEKDLHNEANYHKKTLEAKDHKEDFNTEPYKNSHEIEHQNENLEIEHYNKSLETEPYDKSFETEHYNKNLETGPYNKNLENENYNKSLETEHQSENNPFPLPKEQSNFPPSDDTGYQNMYKMLEAMMPPDKKGSYQNLSMLFKNLSYDDNNNPHDDKE